MGYFSAAVAAPCLEGSSMIWLEIFNLWGVGGWNLKEF